MPSFAQFELVDEFPEPPLRLGKTVMLRSNSGTLLPFIYLRLGGVNQWVSMNPSSSPPSGPAGGVLGGTYPNPSFATPQATVAQLTAAVAPLVLTTDPRLTNARAIALPMTLPARVVTANTAIVPASDYTIAANTTGSAITVTLPPTPGNGERYEVTRITGANQLTIARNGQSIDGGTTNPTVQVKHTISLRFAAGWGWITTDSASAV